MTFYQTEINRIRRICYSNQKQLQTVIALRNFINNNFDNELTLGKLSHNCFTSKFHLLRLFKRYYGLTPTQYLIGKRIEEAKDCLRKGMTVTDTCYRVGFGTPSSFSTLFKQRIGQSPIEFQKRATFATCVRD
ncbi:helix-turn-helix domain-containing protein [Spirosoma humi]